MYGCVPFWLKTIFESSGDQLGQSAFIPCVAVNPTGLAGSATLITDKSGSTLDFTTILSWVLAQSGSQTYALCNGPVAVRLTVFVISKVPFTSPRVYS